MIGQQGVLDGMPPVIERGRCAVCGGGLALAPFYGADPVTYVMRRDRWIKIGKSKHPLTRLAELAAPGRQRYIICPPQMNRAAPIGIVALFPGDVEHELRERFAGAHELGEWFRVVDVAPWPAAVTAPPP